MPYPFTGKGRASRTEFWLINAVVMALNAVFLAFAWLMLSPPENKHWITDDSGLTVVGFLVLEAFPTFLVLGLAAKRRIHDLGSGDNLSDSDSGVGEVDLFFFLLMYFALFFWPGFAGSSAYGPENSRLFA